jgi:hypothetical protein
MLRHHFRHGRFHEHASEIIDFAPQVITKSACICSPLTANGAQSPSDVRFDLPLHRGAAAAPELPFR